jgi:uncharacterized protein (DUF433 family)
MNYLEHFERNPKICAGQWVIKGTRVPVRTILASLAEGASAEEIVNDFPTVMPADVQAVIAYAAAAVQEDIPLAVIPADL